MYQKAFLIIVALLIMNTIDARQTSAQQSEKVRLLVFTKTEGFRHASIPAGVKAVKQIGAEQGYRIDHTEDAARFNEDMLARYEAVIFLNTTGDVLNEQQQNAFRQFIADGGGFVGVHSATDTEFDWPWYHKLVGAYFKGHPRIQEARIRVANREHPATRHLSDEWVRTDEWYNFKGIQDYINVLAYLDESSYEGGKNGENHPIAWYHETLGGRAFYTGGGHTSESFSEPDFRQHLAGGIRYVLGE